ncbi:MAG: polysaccharide biosynthesis protein [Clostridia bacterium]|nr:polysaccharide biosynthesis protein [Clostridia bacterium]
MSQLKKSSFLEGAFIATACIVISKILGILYVIPFYQIIGEDGGALYGYAYNIYNVFLTVSSAGIPFAICKLTSEYNAKEELDKMVRMYRIATRFIVLFSLLSFCICFFFAGAIADLIHVEGGNRKSDVVFVLRSISFTLLIVPLLSVRRGYLQGHKYIRQYSFSQVIEQLVRIIVILAGSTGAVYFLHLPIRYAVGISVLSAGIGALISYGYLGRIVHQNRATIYLNRKPMGSKAEDRLIFKEIFFCAVPFIIINLANTLYTSTDMILVLNTLPKLGFTPQATEFISSVFTTWGTKYNAIIAAVSTGLIVSLIPHIVSDYTKGNHQKVNENFNKCLKILLLIVVPLAVFISINANSFWTVFYGVSVTGPSMIRMTILVTIFDCLYMVLNSLLQSLNKQKTIYVSVILGLLCNLIFDIPFMVLFSKLGLPAYSGAVFATFCGFTVSNTISLFFLRKNLNIHFGQTLQMIPRVILSLILVCVLTVLLQQILPIHTASKLLQIVNLAATGILYAGVYLVFNFRAVCEVLPERLAAKLLHKKNKNPIE